MIDLLAAIEAALRSAMSSEFAQGGAVLMLLGSALALCRSLPGRFFGLLNRQFVVSVDIVGDDDMFRWVTLWLDQHPYSQNARRITASSTYSQSPAPTSGSNSRRTPSARILFTPAPGNHLLWVRGRPVWLIRERKETPAQKPGGYSIFQETFTLRMFGRKPEAARAILEEARDLAYLEETKVGIYVAQFRDWRRIHEVKPRPLSSVILPAGHLEQLIADITAFLELEDWYAARGIPWRRGFLLEGIPGSGKTSTIAAVAGHLGMDLFVVNISDKSMDDDDLVGLMLNVRERSIVMLEDIDCVVDGREVTADSGVTFSGLLNALDGIASRPGVLTFLTSNHSEKLDPALLRRGRVDQRVVFGPATVEQAERLFRHFYDGHLPPALALEFGLRGAGRSMADLQGILLDHREIPAAAVADLYEAIVIREPTRKVTTYNHNLKGTHGINL